jgi:hypothetical protein
MSKTEGNKLGTNISDQSFATKGLLTAANVQIDDQHSEASSLHSRTDER